jgi:hypothetical protein
MACRVSILYLQPKQKNSVQQLFMETDTCEQILKQSIRHALDTFNYKTALFLCERLVATNPDHEHVYLLAKTHFLMGQKNQSLSLLDPLVSSVHSIVLFGTCCLHLSKYKLGEVTLRKWIETHMDSKHLEISNLHSILGMICK